MSEYAFNPISGKLDRIGNGGGGGGGVTTITGDTGSITGANVTVFAENSTKEAGSTVKFVNSGTVSTLKISDSSSNTMLGVDAGNLAMSGSENTAVGATSLQSVTSGVFNTAMGSRCMRSITSGSSNTAYGLAALQDNTGGGSNSAFGQSSLQGNSGSGNSAFGQDTITPSGAGGNNSVFGFSAGKFISSGVGNCFLGYTAGISISTGNNNCVLGVGGLGNLTTGSNNISIGTNSGLACTSSETSNIYIANIGGLGESNKMRLGTTGSLQGQVNQCFIAAITGVTVSASAPTAVDSNGQMSSLGFGTASQVLTSNGSGVSPTWQPKSLAGVVEVTGNYSVLTTDQVVYVDSATPCTITLPATAGLVSGQSFVVKDTSFDASTNNITIIVSGGVVLIDDQASQIISSDGGSLTIRMFNSQYYLE